MKESEFAVKESEFAMKESEFAVKEVEFAVKESEFAVTLLGHRKNENAGMFWPRPQRGFRGPWSVGQFLNGNL